jgi:hypothetical protein
MERPKKQPRKRPERKIQNDIKTYLRAREWFVMEMHGNAFQFGVPDLFASHHKYGHRWIEVKNPGQYKFTAAQLEYFPQFCAHGSGIWIMVAATHAEYQKLFTTPNWHLYLGTMK